MGIKVEIKIECDRCLEIEDLFSKTKSEASLEAKRMGWKLGKETICPKCQ